MFPLPKRTGAGLLDYAGLAIGLSIGFAILTGPMDQLEKAIRRS